MPGRFILDTSMVIELLRGNEVVATQMSRADEVFISTIVLGELYYGAQKSARPVENAERIDSLAETVSVLTPDTETAREYAKTKDELRRKGTPIPENDLWIAALARQHRITLATRDEHHRGIEGMDWVSWQPST